MSTISLQSKALHPDYVLAPRLFAVVTWGCTASRWLAKTLNDCPGVFAVHHAGQLWKQFAGADSGSGLRYLEIIGVLGNMGVAAGDVHGVARSEVAEIREAHGDAFRAVVLVRDPLQRLRSQLAIFRDEADQNDWDVTYLDNLFPQVIKRLPTGSYAERLFVHGVSLLNAIVEEVTIAPIVRMEDLTTNAQALTDLLGFLTGGTVTPPPEWAQAAVSSPRLNPHVRSKAVEFSEWQLRVIADVFDPRAMEIYRRLGYADLLDCLEPSAGLSAKSSS